MREAIHETTARSLLAGLFFDGLRTLSGVIAVAVLATSMAWLAFSEERGRPATLPLAIEAPIAGGEPAAAPSSSKASLPQPAASPPTPMPVMLYLVDTAAQAQIADWTETEASQSGSDRSYQILMSTTELDEAVAQVAKDSLTAAKPIALQVIDLRQVRAP